MQDLNNKLNNGGATADGVLPAEQWNEVASELQNLIESTGRTLSGADLYQVVKSVHDYASFGTFYEDNSVGANAVVLGVAGSLIAPTAYTNGMVISWENAYACTGASTINVAGIGVVPLVSPTGSALVTGDTLVGSVYEARYNSTLSKFLLSITSNVAAPTCKAWASFRYTGGTLSVNKSYNVASITRTAQGRYQITFTVAMPDANYAVVFGNTAGNGGTNGSIYSAGSFNSAPSDKTTTTLTVSFGNGTEFRDCYEMDLAVYG